MTAVHKSIVGRFFVARPKQQAAAGAPIAMDDSSSSPYFILGEQLKCFMTELYSPVGATLTVRAENLHYMLTLEANMASKPVFRITDIGAKLTFKSKGRRGRRVDALSAPDEVIWKGSIDQMSDAFVRKLPFWFGFDQSVVATRPVHLKLSSKLMPSLRASRTPTLVTTESIWHAGGDFFNGFMEKVLGMPGVLPAPSSPWAHGRDGELVRVDAVEKAARKYRYWWGGTTKRARSRARR